MNHIFWDFFSGTKLTLVGPSTKATGALKGNHVEGFSEFLLGGGFPEITIYRVSLRVSPYVPSLPRFHVWVIGTSSISFWTQMTLLRDRALVVRVDQEAPGSTLQAFTDRLFSNRRIPGGKGYMDGF